MELNLNEIREQAAEAARLLLSMAHQKRREDTPVRQTMLGYTVIHRESV